MKLESCSHFFIFNPSLILNFIYSNSQTFLNPKYLKNETHSAYIIVAFAYPDQLIRHYNSMYRLLPQRGSIINKKTYGIKRKLANHIRR